MAGVKLRDKIEHLIETSRKPMSEVAAACGIAYSTFRSYLEDENPRMPAVDTASKIAKFFDVPTDWLWDERVGWPERTEYQRLPPGPAVLVESVLARRALVERDFETIVSQLELRDSAGRRRAETLAARDYHHHKTLPFAEAKKAHDLYSDLCRLVLLEDRIQLLSLNPAGTSSVTTEIVRETDLARHSVIHVRLPERIEAMLRDCPNLLRLAFQFQGGCGELHPGERPGEVIPYSGGFGDLIPAARYERLTSFQQWQYVPLVDDPEKGPPAERPVLISRGQRVPARFRAFVRADVERERSKCFAYSSSGHDRGPADAGEAIYVCEPGEPDRTGIRPCLVVFGHPRRHGMYVVDGDRLKGVNLRGPKAVQLRSGDEPQFYPVIAGPFPHPPINTSITPEKA